MDGDVNDHRVHKTLLKHVLSDQRLVARIHSAVEAVHEMTSTALEFGKLFYLATLDDMIVENGHTFDHRVAGRMASVFPIDGGQIEEWMDVVSSRLVGRVGPPYAPEKLRRLQRMHDFYDEASTVGLLPSVKISCSNLSVPKGYAASLLATNYENNVRCHFDQYVKRIVRARLEAMTRIELGVDLEVVRLSKEARRRLVSDVSAVVNDILEGQEQPSCRAELATWMVAWRAEFTPPAPANADPFWRFYNQKVHPERWLPYMVWMNRKLEEEGATDLLSPLPQRSTFVPGHIRLDTTALVDLIVADGEETLVLKTQLEDMDMGGSLSASASGAGPSSSVSVKYDLPGLLVKSKKHPEGQPSKAQLYVNLEKLVSPSLVSRVKSAPAQHGSAFKTSIWRCLTKIGPGNKHAGLDFCGNVFNNMIDTDGHAVSIHYVARHLVGVTRFNGGFKILKESQKKQKTVDKAKGATYVTQLSPEERAALLPENCSGTVVGLDPGKSALATATDGTGKVVRYTAVQRRVESGAKKHTAIRRKMLNAKPKDPNMPTMGELVRSIGTVPGYPGSSGPNDVVRSSKSCMIIHYEQYLFSRRLVTAELSTFFRRPEFRSHRYDAHVGRRASEDRFASRIKRAFGKVAVLLYGNWGKSPNLRNQPPTPGVGLRRRLSSYFTILLVYEAYTSSVCPRCRRFGLIKPRRDRKGDEIHHLLKCSHTDCSCRWWNRDDLGALNIRKMGIHALRTGSWDPLFSRAAAAAA